MASGAIASQGAVLSIKNSTTGAVTISGITLGGHTKITGTHALAVGDVVTFADIVGTVQLNGTSHMVTAIETTTDFWIDVDSQAYTAWSSAGTATPAAYAAIGDVLGWSGPGGTATVIDISNLQSTWKEKLMGLPDEGQFSFDLNLHPDDTGQLAVRAARAARSRDGYKLVYSNGTIDTWWAYTLGFQSAGAVDDKVTASVTLEIDGPISRTP